MAALKSVENNSQTYEFNSGWQRLERNNDNAIKISKELEGKLKNLRNDVNSIIGQIKKVDAMEINIDGIKISIAKIENTVDEMLVEQNFLKNTVVELSGGQNALGDTMEGLKKQNYDLLKRLGEYRNVLDRHDDLINELLESIEKNDEKHEGFLSRIVGKR